MKPIETVHIVGMGALGLLYGSIIQKSLGADTVTYVMDPIRYEKYKNATYRINGAVTPFRIIPCTEATPCDLLIVAVKNPGLTSALEVMKTSVGPDTAIVSVMNGATSEETIGGIFGMERMLHTVAQGTDATCFGGHLNYSAAGYLCLGVVPPAPDALLDRVCAFFDKAGISYVREADILRRIWSKYMLNVGLNQSCMVFGTTYGDINTEGSESRMTMVAAMREVILVANAEGIALCEEDLRQYLELMLTMAPDNMPSMAQDRVNKKHSEVDMFAGNVLKLAEKHGIPAPANAFLLRRVREIEAEY